ncbi:MAG: hypothetical protein AAB590_03915 [Patescibacteria group bacterium]
MSLNIRQIIENIHKTPGLSREDGVFVSSCQTAPLYSGKYRLTLGIYHWNGLESKHLFDVYAITGPFT